MNLPTLTHQWIAPFQQSPFRLRFELGGETFGNDMPVPRFVQAFGRAKQVAFDAFQNSRRVLGIVAFPFDGSSDCFAPVADAPAALRDAGFSSEPITEWKAPFWNDPEEDEPEELPTWRVFDLIDNQTDRDVLIWCSVAYEMAIQPAAPVLYLLDPDANVLVYVYDDRGMDVTSLDREPLRGLYRERNDWILDYDRPRIEEAFGPIS